MDAEDPRREAARLISTQAWCALGTVDAGGVPLVTYAPFAPVDGAFGIAVTRLAAHTVNLLERRPASVLVVDAGFAGDAYAQPRITVAVTARPNPAGSAQAGAVWSALSARHGETVSVLRTLPDFEAISLEPVSGRLILGFAAAHDLDGGALAELLRTAAR